MLLGLGESEARIKFNYGAPEVWSVSDDEERAALVADALRAAGLSVSVVPAQDLLTVPPSSLVLSFSLADDGLVAETAEGEVRLGYDTPTTGVFCKPPADFASGDPGVETPHAARGTIGPRARNAIVNRLSGLGHSRLHQETVELLERRTNLDLCFANGEGLRRISVALGVVDFSGLGEAASGRDIKNMETFVAECERRFTDLVIDKRLENVRPRQRLTLANPVPGSPDRKLFSFGTVALKDLLEAVSPELGNLTQFELGTRLSYLLRRAEEPV